MEKWLVPPLLPKDMNLRPVSPHVGTGGQDPQAANGRGRLLAQPSWEPQPRAGVAPCGRWRRLQGQRPRRRGRPGPGPFPPQCPQDLGATVAHRGQFRGASPSEHFSCGS